MRYTVNIKSLILKSAIAFLLACAFAGDVSAQAAHSTQAGATAFKVIAFFSTWEGPGKGFLGKDPAHISFAHESNAFFPTFAAQNNFVYDSTENWDNLNDSAFLAKYNVVMFLCDQPRPNEYAAFQKYMERGGAWLGFHVVAYNDADPTSPKWPWYYNTFLGGGLFKTNTWWPTSTKLHVEDTSHPVTKGFPSVFTSEVSEWYGWQNDLRKNPDIKILCSIDQTAFPVGTDPNQSWTSGYYPIVWTNTKYKMLYCNSGHNYMNYTTNTPTSFTWSNAQHVKLIYNALKWLAGVSNSTEIGLGEESAKTNPALRLSYDRLGLSVSRSDTRDFGIAILDLQGNKIAGGKSASGLYSSGMRLKNGFYIIQTKSNQGNTSATLNVH